VAALAATALMALRMLHPPRMTDARAAWVLKRLSPADLGLAYESVRFVVPDGSSRRHVRLAAWWIPARPTGSCCAVLLHGYGDARVVAIAWAPMLHELGCNVLALDLRAHGESEGRFITCGVRERQDVSCVIDELRRNRPEQTRRLILFGISYGGAVAAAVAADRADIAGVVLDSPAMDLRRAAQTHCDLHGLPGSGFQKAAVLLARLIAGVDFSAVRTAELLPRIVPPVMVVHCGRDVYVSPQDDQDLRRAAEERQRRGLRTVLWTVEDALHMGAIVARGDEYRRRLKDFLTSCGT